MVAGVLAFVFGSFGVHNFYMGYTKKAIIRLVLTISVLISMLLCITSCKKIEKAQMKKYQIEHMTNGSLPLEIMEIDLIKHDETSELEYKVPSKEFVAENYTISVLLDSAISIYNVVADTAYKETSTTYEDKYLINYILKGEWFWWTRISKRQLI